MDVEGIFREALERKSVFKNRDVISPHYIPDHLPFREDQMKEISKTLAPILSGRKPENIFIYGKPGTGKTAVTKTVVNKLVSFARERGIPVVGVYVNCRIHSTRYRVFAKVGSELMPGENFAGFSFALLYERIFNEINTKDLRLIVVLDEIDRLRGAADTVYALNRTNDELERGSISLIGISNNLLFKEKLDPRTRSTLCEKEMVFPPYNAQELYEILRERAEMGFREGAVKEEAISLAAAYAAQESGDARFGLLLLLRAGEIADEKGGIVGEGEVREARRRVEEDVILDLVSSLPDHEQLVLFSIASLTKERRGIKSMGGEEVLVSGEVYDRYRELCRELGKNPVSDRWFREYISELEMYGLLHVSQSGKGFRGQTRIIKLTYDPERILSVLKKRLF